MSRLLFAGVILTFLFSSPAFADDVIYKSANKLDFVKIGKAKKEEKAGGLKHPYTFEAGQIRDILRSIRFNKKNLIMKDQENRALFDEQNVEFLAPYLIEAFKKTGPDQAVVVSYFTRDSKALIIQDDRLTVFRAFVKDDGLHLRFNKLYAKLQGDRVTMGADRMAQEARGLRVGLEVQPGQNRISWKPEELVFDLSHFTSQGVVSTSDKAVSSKDKKESKKNKKVKEEESQPKQALEDEGKKSVRQRLKELDQLKADELITEKEYQKKRQELIKEL